MSEHDCDCEYCEHRDFTYRLPPKPDDYAEVLGSSKPHVITEQQMAAELEDYHAHGQRMVEPWPPALYVGVAVPRRPRLRRRIAQRLYGAREHLAAAICPWDIYERD